MSLQTLYESLSYGPFWILAGTFFICGLSSTGIVNQHFVPFCGDMGVSALVAASFLAMMGVFNFIGTVGSGWLSDRFDNRALLAWYYGLRGLSLIWLPFSSFDLFSLSLFAIFFGLDYIATVPPTVKLAGLHFGPEKAAIVFGWAFAAHQLGSATSAAVGGVWHPCIHGSFWLAGCACGKTGSSRIEIANNVELNIAIEAIAEKGLPELALSKKPEKLRKLA
jgi:predicted MFS family arabinose efflux permease